MYNSSIELLAEAVDQGKLSAKDAMYFTVDLIDKMRYLNHPSYYSQERRDKIALGYATAHLEHRQQKKEMFCNA